MLENTSLQIVLNDSHIFSRFDLPNPRRYIFRCHPKSKDGRHYLVSVNDIAFSPLYVPSYICCIISYKTRNLIMFCSVYVVFLLLVTMKVMLPCGMLEVRED